MQAASLRDRVRERDREDRTSTNTLHEHEFKARRFERNDKLCENLSEPFATK